MKEQTYKVVVNENGTYWYNEIGQRHREGGLPAIECATGSKFWYVNGECVTKQTAKELAQSCQDKVVEIDGVKYKLVKV